MASIRRQYYTLDSSNHSGLAKLQGKESVITGDLNSARDQKKMMETLDKQIKEVKSKIVEIQKDESYLR